MTDLHPCPHCRRHVRLDEVDCPFCSGRLDPEAARRYHRLRLAQVKLSCALAAAALSCSGSAPAARPASPPAQEAGDEAGTADDSETRHEQTVEDLEPVEAALEEPNPTLEERLTIPIYSDGPPYLFQGIPFRMHSTRMLPGTEKQFDDIVGAMRARPEWRVEIQGHADGREGRAAGWLSKVRAQVVHDEVVRRGIAPTRLRVVGVGASQALVGGPPERNPRVVFRVVEADPDR